MRDSGFWKRKRASRPEFSDVGKNAPQIHLLRQVVKASQLGALGGQRMYIVHIVRSNCGSIYGSLKLENSERHVVVVTEQYQNAK